MKLRRTANAGVLLELDGVTILLDGVCREVKPYPATPPEEREALTACFPDVVCFTHAHKDHYDPAFAGLFQTQTGGAVFGPLTLPGCKATMEDTVVKGVYILPVPSRHIGLGGKDVDHASFILQGSRCVWFLGDAAPTQWKGKDLPKPDVLVVPYAYANTPSGWTATKTLGADHVVLLHMPNREDDTVGLWNAVTAVLETEDQKPAIVAMREEIQI